MALDVLLIFLASIVFINHGLKETVHPMVTKPATGAFGVAFMDDVIHRIRSLDLIETPAVIARFFSVVGNDLPKGANNGMQFNFAVAHD
ncbi:MAG TPA: hypothetical protein DHW77_05370 [Verrucomicrobiales bacterium]|nr:hypothetical protein [Verrucomicrobiales bacterium]